MSELVLGLLVLGGALFAGVIVYNSLQERSARRAAQRAFAAHFADPLAAEPVLEKPAKSLEAQPDPRVDYVIELDLERPAAPAVVLEGWAPIQSRFARRAMLTEGETASKLSAALQLVSRAGVVSEAELLEFRAAVETLGTTLGATLAAPEMRPALEAARELDRACSDSDIQVALHVVGTGGMAADLGEQPFQVVRREDGVTLVLDVAVTPDLERSYEAMVRAGRSLADAHGARLVDDRGNALDERALASIGAQLEAVRQTLAGHGIETGSPLALRLFS
ncbi:MAG TPA: cell division protein ZipA C-terminal FtsZ-binding domain-containing protein [Burkholderiales bacterium]|nr:cell division protein ZipA C-terminal FtsZ-binding domain-containing protein [Burkholderiales bacterium]